MTHQCHEEANRAPTRRTYFEARATYINDNAFLGNIPAEAKLREPGSAMNMEWMKAGRWVDGTSAFFVSN